MAETAAPLSEEANASIGRRSGSIERLDAQFAYVTSLSPLVMTILAFALLPFGFMVTWVEVMLFLVMYVLVMIGLEVGYHRYFSHHPFVASRPVKIGLAVLGSMGFQGPVIWWAATHRRHHRFSDHDGDPHSPRRVGPGWRGALRGLYEGHMGWLFDKNRARPDNWWIYAKDLYADPDIFKIHYHYFYWMLFGLVFPAVVGGLIHGTLKGAFMGLLWGGFVRVFFGDHFIRTVNSVSHVVGSRAFETKDNSRNNFWLAVPTLGQAWHHNHHAFPAIATTKIEWYQVDLGYWVIRSLELVKLVSRVRLPTAQSIASKRIGAGTAAAPSGEPNDVA